MHYNIQNKLIISEILNLLLIFKYPISEEQKQKIYNNNSYMMNRIIVFY